MDSKEERIEEVPSGSRSYRQGTILMANKERALRDIEQLIYDELWGEDLVGKILGRIIEMKDEADYRSTPKSRDTLMNTLALIDDEPTHRQPPAKLWERMIIDGLTGDVTFLPEDEAAADENWNLQADIAPVTLEDVFTYIADQETDDV